MAKAQPDPIRAVVVDDEPLARDELRFLLEQCEGLEVVGDARGASEALDRVEALSPELAFVDLRMPGPDGIALAEALKERHPEIQVVLISAHDEGALRAFDVEALDYLLKPVRLERLRATLDRARERLSRNEESESDDLDRLAVRRKGAYVVVDIADVLYFEVKDELVWAVTAGDRYAIDLTLTALEKRLSAEEFFRCHRGFLVRLTAIRYIEPTGSGTFDLTLDHPESPRVPLARERVRLLRQRIPFTG